MVAIISGNSQGLSLTSLSTLGQNGVLGQAANGRSGEQAFVNVANGNLVLQDRDDVLASHGQDVVALRTYNSQGQLIDDNGDNWTNGFYGQQLKLMGGAVNATGTTLNRIDRDGAQSGYTLVGTPSSPYYVNTSGGGAFDTITYDAGTSQYVWVDGQTGEGARYDASNGRLVSSTDAAGNRTDYTYDTTSGRLLNVKSASGETVYYDYSGSNLTQIRTVNASSVTLTRVRYGYDTSNRLSTVTVDLTPADNVVADGKTYVTTYTYDGTSKRVASVTQTDGTSLAITYDGNGRVATLKDALNQTTSFTYDTTNSTTTVTDPLLRQTVYTYDVAGRLTKIQAPATGGATPTTQFSYNGYGDLTQTVDGEGHTVDMAYDTNGNQTLQRDGAGNTVTRTYTSNNLLLTETVYLTPDPDGAGTGQPALPTTTRYVYSSTNAWQLRFVLSPSGLTTEYRYNNYGERIASIQYQAGSYTVSGLAQAAVPTEAQLTTWVGTQNRAATTRTDLVYDARGQLQTSTTWNQVDTAGAGVVDGKQALTQYVYDQAGQLLSTISPTVGTSQYTYDGLGRLLSSTDANSQTALTSYDDAGGKTVVTAANGLVTTSAYDKAGRLTNVQQSSAQVANLGTTQYLYDGNNHLAMTIDPTGVRNWFLYDEDGRKVAEINDVGALTETVYNKDNQVTKTTAYYNGVNTSLLVDANNKPTNPALSAIRPVLHSSDSSNWYAYDNANRLSKRVDALGAVTETRYDGASRIVKVMRYAAVITTTGLTDTPTAASIAPVTSAASDRITRNLYNEDGLLRGTLDAEGYLVEFFYNPAGQVTGRTAYATRSDTAQWAAGTLDQLRPVGTAQDQATTYLLNSKGQIAGEVDPEKYLTENVYDAAGNLAQTVRYANKVTATVTATSTVASLRPTASTQDRSSTWQYDALNRVVQATNYEGTVTTSQYDSVGNLVKTSVGAGLPQARTLAQRYDVQGRLIAELTAEGSAQLTGGQTQVQIDAIWTQYGLAHTYDAAGRRTSTRDQNGNTTLFYYDKRGLLTYTINALGEVSEATYNALGQMATSTQFANRISTSGLVGGFSTSTLTTALAAARSSTSDQKSSYTYNLNGLLSQTLFSTFSKNVGYSAFGDITGQNTITGGTSTSRAVITYDRRSQVKTSNEGSSTFTAQTWDAFGRLATVGKQGQADTVSFAYDRLGRQITTTDATLKATVSTYDAFGQVLTLTDALNATTTYTYDRANRSVIVTTPEGVSVSTVHNEFGQTAQTTNGNGNTTTFQYDKNGNLKTTTNPLATSTNTYDNANRLTQTVDAAGNVVALAYDAANRVLTRRVDPTGLNLVTSYAYFVPDTDATDAKGRMMTVTDPNGVLTKLIYGIDGQLAQQIVDPTGLKLVTSYTYDGDGKTRSVTSPGGTLTQYTYDAAERRTKEQIDPAGLNLTRTYVYDGMDNLTSSTDANGNVTRYAYDLNHRLVYTLDAAGNVQQNVYDADGRITQTRSFAKAIDSTGLSATPSVADILAKVATDLADQVQNRVYDRDGRVVATVNGLGEVVRFVYDGNGNVTVRTAYAQRIDMATWVAGTVPAPTADAAHDQVQRTVYDKLNRATFTIDGLGAVVAQSFDNNGRLTQRIAYATAIPVATAATDAAVRAAVALVASSAKDSVTRYVYDKAGRQTYSLSSVGTSAQAAVTQTVYDGNGNRIKQVRFASTVAMAANPTTVATNANDEIQVWAYDTANRSTFQVDAVGAVTAQVFDANGNVVATKQYAAVLVPATLTSLQTSPTTAVATLTAALPALGSQDRITHNVYDLASRLRYSVDAEGGIAQYSYDGVGHVVQQTSYAKPTNPLALADKATAANLTTAIVVDAANDRSTRSFFDAAGRQRFELDALGYVTETSYAVAGKTRTIRYAQKPTGITPTSTTADIAAAVAVAALATDTNNHTTETRLDAAGRVFETVDEMGVVTHREFDALGQLRSQTQAYGLAEATQTTYDYSAQGLVVSQTVAAGTTVSATTQYSYNALGQLITQTEAVGVALLSDNTSWAQSERQRMGYPLDFAALNAAQKTNLLKFYSSTNTYDAAGKLTSTKNGLDATTSTLYNAFGNAVKVTDPNGNVGYFYYDKLNRVTLQVDPEGYATQTQYWQGLSDKVASVRRYATKVAANTNENALPTLQTVAATDGLTTYTYDRLDRLLSTTERVGTGTATESVQYSDASGNRFNKRVTNKLGGVGSFTVDQLGNTTQESLPTGVVNAYQYDAFGNRIQTIEAQGRSEQRTTTYRYDKAGRTTLRIGQAYTALDAGTNTTQTVTPVEQTIYDALGRAIETRKGATWDGSNVVGGNRTLNYFDAQGHQIALVTADGAYTEYTLDAAGNRLVVLAHSVRISVPGTPGGTRPVLARDWNNDRVTSYVYDYVGRPTKSSLYITGYWEPSGSDTLSLTYAGPSTITLQQTDYDAAGNVLRTTDARGNYVYTYYDKLGRKTLSIDQEGYATAWDYVDFQDVATRETRYSNKVVAAYARQNDSAATAAQKDPILLRQSIVAGTTEPDRVTEYVLDTTGHVLEKRVKNVAYQYTTASGAVTTGTADAVTGYSIDGLGHITQLRERVSAADNVTNVTDIVYDTLGREIERLAPGFTDYQGATVRPTSDTEYNGLGAVTRSIQRGTNGASEADDRITSYQYNINGDRIGQTDAEGNATVYQLDAKGQIARATLKNVRNADGVLADQATSYWYDAMGRQTQSTDAGTGEVRKLEYNAFGEITRKGLGDGRQEYIQYDTRGLVQRSNTGDGVSKIYLYDRTGNATRQIKSTTVDLSAVSISAAAVDASLVNTFSVYDKKNQLLKTVEPDISYLKDSISVQQAFTQQLADLYGQIGLVNATGGAYAGAAGASTALQPSSVAAAGQYGLLPQANAPYVSSITTAGLADPQGQTQLQQTGAFGLGFDFGKVTNVGSSSDSTFPNAWTSSQITLPEIGFPYRIINQANGAISDTFNGSGIVLANNIGSGNYAFRYGDYTVQVKLNPNIDTWTDAGSFTVGQLTQRYSQGGDKWVTYTFYNTSVGHANKYLYIPPNTFGGQSPSYYRAYTSSGQEIYSIPIDNTGGYFKLDASFLPSGTYGITLRAFNSNGLVIGGETSTLNVSAGSVIGTGGYSVGYRPVVVDDPNAANVKGGSVLNNKNNLSILDVRSEFGVLYFDKFASTPGTKTINIRRQDGTVPYAIREDVSGGGIYLANRGFVQNVPYEYVITANGKDWWGTFVIGADGNPQGTGPLREMLYRDASKADRGQTVTLNLAGGILNFDGDYSHYYLDFSYQKPDGSWQAIWGAQPNGAGQITFGLDTDLAPLNASAFVAGSASYGYSVYKRQNYYPELVSRVNGTLTYGAATASASVIAQPFYIPKGQVQLPAGTTATGPVSVTYNGATTVLAAGDWRAALNTSNNILTLDLTTWMWTSSDPKSFAISFNVGADSYTGTLSMDSLGHVTPSQFTKTSPSPKIHVDVTGASNLSVFKVGRSDGALAAVSAGSLSTTGAGSFEWNAATQQAAGGSWRYYYEAVNASNQVIGKGYGTLTVNANGTLVSTPDAPLLKPAIVSFTPPANSTAFTLQVRPKGSTGAYTTYNLTTPFQWDATAWRPAAGANPVELEYLFTATDASTNLLSKGSGTITINNVGSTTSTIKMDRQPTKISLQSPPGRAVYQISFGYRPKGSTAAYTTVTIPGVWNAALNATTFTWDASALAPETGTSTYEYQMRMQNSGGSDYKNEVGDSVTANGEMVLGGNTGAPLSFQQYVQTLNVAAQVKHMQTYNAFGEVVSEYDDKVAQRMQDMVAYYKTLPEYAGEASVQNATVDANAATIKSSYNALGQLISKTDPQTWVTSDTGLHSRVAPVTTYGYDLLGRLNTATDANNHQQRQSFVGSSSQLLAKQWAADGGQKQFAYDIFADARKQTNELGAVTLQTYNKLDQLVQVDRLNVARVQNFAGGTDGTAVASTLTDRYTYDMLGQRITHTDALSQIDKTYYDSLGRVTKTVSPSGATVTYTYVYMAAGTSNGILSAGGLNTGGYQRTTTGADGRSVVDKIDTFGRTTWHQDEGGRQYTYTYDAAGLLKSQSSTLGGNVLQNILYDYYANGFIKAARDLSNHTLSRYGYDNAGNRTWESYSGLDTNNTSPLGSYQNVTIQYDELNRMAHVKDLSVDVQYEYDAVGNRRAVHATYFDPLTAGFRQRDDMWYTYDAADRFTLTKGSLTAMGGQIVRGAQGVSIGYDLAGQRISATAADGTVETYSYSTDGYLEDTKINGTLRARRRVDALGRTLNYVEKNADGSTRQDTKNTYGADNRLQTAVGMDGSTTKYFYFTDTADTDANANQAGYGQLARTEYVPGQTGTSSKNFYTYQYWDDAKQLTIKTQANNQGAPGWAPGTSQMVYDVNGFLTDANDVAGNRTLHYTNSATGLVVRRDETSAGKTYQHFYYYAAGNRIGDVTTDPNDKFRKSYAEELAVDLKNQPSNADRFKNFHPVTSADFDQNYEPINSNYPAATASNYTVRAGDTLASIAQSLWGDSSMWYLLADANALKSTDSLTAGRVLIVPNKVTNIHNNANTFRPYNAGEMIGHVDPTLPAPPPPPGKGGCGGIGKIIMVVVAVVATIYTAGALSGATGGFLSTMSAGASVLGGSAGLTLGTSIAVGAAAGAVGSIASQLVGMATGDVHSFSWKAVGQSALGSGITAGIGSGLSELGKAASLAPSGSTLNSVGNAWAQAGQYAKAAITAAGSTGINMVLHGDWSWRQMGASVVGAMAGVAAGSAINSVMQGSLQPMNQFTQRLASGMVGSWASSEVMAGHNGFTKADSSVLFTSALGNAIGQGIADGPTQGATQGLGPWSDGDYRNGSDIQSDDAPIQRQLAAGGNATWDDVSQPSMADRYAQVYGGEVQDAGDRLNLSNGRIPNGRDSGILNTLQSQLKRSQANLDDLTGLAASANALLTDGDLASMRQENLTRMQSLAAQPSSSSVYIGSDGARSWTDANGTLHVEISGVGSSRVDTSASDMDIAARAAQYGSIQPMGATDAFFTFNPVGQGLKGVGTALFDAWTALPRAVIGAGNLVGDAVGYASNAIAPQRSVLTGQPFPYQPQSGLLQNIQQQGVLGTLGTGITGAVRNAPGIGLIGALGSPNRDWGKIGAQAFNTGVAGVGMVGSLRGGASTGFGLQTLDPTATSFTQSWVSFQKAGASYNLDSLVQSMKTDGWIGKPVDVVRMPDGMISSIDNTRILAARRAGIEYQGNVRGFDELINDPVRQLSLRENGVVPNTWGEAAQMRIFKPTQNQAFPGWSQRFPYGSIYDPLVR